MSDRSLDAMVLDTAHLREFGARHGNQGRDETSKLFGAAADEIDRLRALVAELQKCRHTRRNGHFKDGKLEEWCADCYARIEPLVLNLNWDGVKPINGGER